MFSKVFAFTGLIIAAANGHRNTQYLRGRPDALVTNMNYFPPIFKLPFAGTCPNPYYSLKTLAAPPSKQLLPAPPKQLLLAPPAGFASLSASSWNHSSTF